MRKIRTDLIGVVLAAGRNFAPGEDVPDDVAVDAQLLDASAPAKSEDEGAKSEDEGDQQPADPAQDAEKPAESDEKPEEDYSDLLGGDDAEKPAQKRSTGRRTSSRKS